jgi:hypothetical protein
MHASRSKRKTFRSSCVRDGSIYAPEIRTGDDTTIARLTAVAVDGTPSPELWESRNPAALLVEGEV